jgi:hypothetical protein
VNTPSGLNTDSPAVKQALADAVTDLRSSRIPLDAPLRGYQYDERGGEKIPIHGGPGTLGVFNAINVLWKPGQGYPDVPHGSSFIMAMQFTAKGPQSRAFVTYGESENPKSPYANDQTKLFSRKHWTDMKFTPEKILSDRALKVTQIGCVQTPGFRSARVRRSGRGLRFAFKPQLKLPVGVAVYRVSRGGRVTRPVRVARFSKRRSFRWRRSLRSGWYVARLRARAATGKNVDVRKAFRVRGRRLSLRGPRFDRADSCGLVEAMRLSSPLFRGSRHRSLGVTVRAGRKARVTVSLRRGRHTVRKLARRLAAGRTRHLRFGSKGLRPGAYRVVATVRAGRSRKTVRLSARAL